MEVTTAAQPLMNVYRGWEGYQISLVHALTPLSSEQWGFRPLPDQASVAEIARHISAGRLNWFIRMDAPQSAELARRIPEWAETENGNRYIVEASLSTEPETLIGWLEATWQMVEATLHEWDVRDLEQTYHHVYQGKTYAVSRQWTVWRILSHDMHHGGQLSQLLYMQGIEPLELGLLGGHLTEPPLVEDTNVP